MLQNKTYFPCIVPDRSLSTFFLNQLVIQIIWFMLFLPRDEIESLGAVTLLSSHSWSSENGEVAPSPWMAEGPFSEKETLTSSPPPVKNGEFSEKVSPQASCFSPGVMEAHTFLR